MAYVVSHIIENFKEHMLLVQKEAYPAILASYFAFWKITPLCWSFLTKIILPT